MNGSIGPNPNGAQCTNVSNSAAALLGIPASYGDAIELNYPGSLWVPNEPANHPPAGAIIIFNAEYPYDTTAGHTGWALHACNPTELHILWQNDPDGSPCEAVITDYTACKGWWVLSSDTAEWGY
jgi:hypothetical protein